MGKRTEEGNKKLGILRQVFTKKSGKLPAVFLDRDGTIIRYYGVPKELQHVRPLVDAFSAVRILNDLGYLCIVVTNQPIIEKCVISPGDSDRLNEEMRKIFLSKGAVIDAVYTCPHRYGTVCVCRKPDLGLIRAAQKDFNIDMKRSWLVGDTTRDMETGSRAKLKTVLVKTGDGGKDIQFFKTKGNYEAKNVLSAVKIIIGK